MLISPSLTRRQSCDRCHSRKQRCVRTSSEPCLRCKAARKECVYSPPLRPGRPRNKRPREDVKSKERGPKNGSSRVPSTIPSTAAVKRTKGPTSVNMLEDSFLANSTPSTSGFDDNESDVSSWMHVPRLIAPDASNTLPPTMDENTDFERSCSNNCGVPPGNTNEPYNTVANGMDELWLDFLNSNWQQDVNDTSNGMELPSPVESLESSPAQKKPHLPIRGIHSILLLSEINLQLHKIHTPSSPQCSKWKTSLDCTIQAAQSFIQALSKLTSENNTTCKLPSARKLQTPRPAFLTALGTPKEGSKPSNPDWAIHGLQNPPLHMPFNRQVDNIVAHLALICYAQIIRCYKSLTIMLSDTLVWAESNPDDQPCLLPIRIGTLEASVSPFMHIAMLAHLISYHVDELSEKIRQLGTLLMIDDGSQDEAVNHSLRDMIKADTHHEVEDLRDALAFVMDKLHVKSQP